MNLPQTPLARILICAVSLVALFVPLGLWWRAVRLRRTESLPVGRVLARLDETRALMQPEDARLFAQAVAEVLRSYIDVRFRLRAAHQTTEEFLHQLLTRPNDLLGGQRALLADFLRRCDLARFERWILPLEEMDALLSSARDFVLRTSRPE